MNESTNTGAGYGGAAGMGAGVGGGTGAAGSEGAGGDEGSRFGRAYGAASEKVRDGYNAMRERVEDVDVGAITDQIRTYVRSNPGKALLFSIGAGFVIGLLLRRNEEDEE